MYHIQTMEQHRTIYVGLAQARPNYLWLSSSKITFSTILIFCQNSINMVVQWGVPLLKSSVLFLYY